MKRMWPNCEGNTKRKELAISWCAAPSGRLKLNSIATIRSVEGLLALEGFVGKGDARGILSFAGPLLICHTDEAELNKSEKLQKIGSPGDLTRDFFF